MVAKVYIAGPYTKGDVALNVRKAYEAANQLADLGFAPFVPHATRRFGARIGLRGKKDADLRTVASVF